MEDVAIAYGYNNIEETIPKSMTIANQVCALCVTSLLQVNRFGKKYPFTMNIYSNYLRFVFFL